MILILILAIAFAPMLFKTEENRLKAERDKQATSQSLDRKPAKTSLNQSNQGDF